MSRKAMRNYLKAVSQRVDRKKMYKAKKQWIVAGMSFLVAMGIGTAVNVNSHASTVDSANAPVTKVANQKPQIIQHQAKQLHNQVLANTSLNNDKMIHNTNSTMIHNINNSSSASAKSSSVAKPASAQSSLDSQNQASSVESNVASSASQSSKSMRGGIDSVSNVVKPSSNSTRVNSVVSASAKGSVSSTGVSASNSTSNQVAKSAVSSVDNSKSVASNIKKPVSASKAKLNSVASASSSVSSSKVTKGFGATRQNKPLMLDASNGTTGRYEGLNYKYDPTTQSLEFTSGTASRLRWFNRGRIVRQAKSIKFDDNIDTSHVTNMSHMFADDVNLQSLEFGNGFNTSRAHDMDGMFNDDSNLKTITINSSDTKFTGSNMLPIMYQELGFTNSEGRPFTLSTANDFSKGNVGTFTTNRVIRRIPRRWEGSYDGLNYVFNPRSNQLEFIDGNANSDLSHFMSDAPVNIRQARSIMFDAPININSENVSDMSDMFSGDRNIQSVTITSPNIKFSDAGLPTMYKEIGQNDANGTPYTSTMTNDFSKGNVGTFTKIKNPAPTDITGIYYGLHYKYTINTNTLEFTSGTLMWNGSNRYFNNDIFIGRSYDDTNIFTVPNVPIQNIKVIKFDNNVDTSKVTDMNGMFDSDEALQSLDLGNEFDTSKVTNMSGMFNNDYHLQSLNLGNNFDTSKVTNMRGMFNNDGALQSLDLGNHFDTSNVTNMNKMFNGDKALQSLDLGNHFDTSKVTDMDDIFGYDEALQSLDLGNNFDTSNVTDMNSMFNNDYHLQSLDLGNNFDTSNVTDMNSMFNNDYHLQSLDLGNNFDTSNVTDMSDMFNNDEALQSLIIASPLTKFNNTAGVPTLFQETGQNDPNGKPYTLSTPNDFSKGNVGTFVTPANVKPKQVSYSDIYGSSDGLSSNIPKATATPKSTDLGNDWAYVNAQGIESKTPIKNAQGHVMIAPAYRGLVYHLNNSNSNLEFTSGTADNDMQYFWRDFPHKVRFGTTFDPNVDMSHVTNMSHMFDGIGSDGLNLGNHFDTHNVTDMSYMFNGLADNTITIPENFDTSNVTNMSHMFAGHNGNVVLSNTFVTPKVTDMSDMFVQSGVKLPDSFDPSNVTNMSGMFASDNVSDTLDKNFDTHNVTNMSGMFSGAYANSITLPSKFNTSKVTNMSSMFSRCGFNSIDLGSNFYTNNVTNMGGMFHSDSPVTLNLGPHFNTASVNRDSNGASPFSSDQGIQNIIAPNTCVIPSKYAGLASQDGYNWYVKGNPQPNETLFDNNSNRPVYATYTLQPIPKVNTTINYINQNGTNVGTQKDQSAKGTNISLNIPNGYHLTNNTPVTANGGTQNVNVTGNQVNIQGTLHLTYNSKRGSNLINTNKVDKPITISGNVGNTVQAADPFDYIEVGYGLPSTLTPWSVAITNNMGKQSDSFTYNGQIAGQLTVIYTDITPGHVKSDVGHQVLGDLGNEGQVVELAPNTNHDTKFDSSTGNRIYDALQTPTGFTLEKNLNYITLQLHKNPIKLTLSLSEPVIRHHVTPKVVKPTNHDKKNQPNKPVTPVINHKKVTPVKPHTDTHKVIRPKHDNKNQAHKVVTPKKPNKVINNHKVVKPTQPVVNHKSNNKKPVTPIKPKNHVVPAKPKTNNTHKSVSPVKPTDSKAKGKVINHNNKPVQPKVVKPVNHKSNTNKQTKPTKVISHKNKPVAPINHKSDSTKPVAKKNNKQVVPNKVNKNQPKAHESVMPLKPNVPTVINTYNYQSDNNDNSVKALIAKLEVKPEVKNDDATVSFKPKQFINHQVTNLNKIKVGHIANYRGMRVERVRGLKHYHFNRYVRIYTNIKLGHKAYAKLVKASKIRVVRAYKIHGKHGKYIRYEVRIGKRNYFVSRRALKHHVIRKHLRKLIHHLKHLR